MARRGASPKFHAEDLGPWGAETREQSIEKFWAFVDKTSHPTGCWLWTSYTNEKGYGLMSFAGKGNVRAHRVSYELAHGVTLVPKQFLMHHCDNPLCVNPDHLSICNNKDNIVDMFVKGRHPYQIPPERLKVIRSELDAVEGWSAVAQVAAKHDIGAGVAMAIKQRKKYWYIK